MKDILTEYSYPAGYYDASNILNEIFVIAENSTAYGTNSNIYSTADIDTYSLGILNSGTYVVDVDDYTWDSLNFDYGSVSKFSVLNSLGYEIVSSYNTYTDLSFNVSSPETFMCLYRT